ncbi:hypothetical protein A3C23_03910 [Candidatus Roizmanbacteria bacterium RIFCSPHIGHO2_02_FULL_37_13b]|uniref:YdbS-like PH domain-containing protein n=1 Tax=Candidatus Roizmanbacteria bacterium RIFCSPLOWO2_02_FULL_36_11 TaxID=1802071 RepID=A0A1F7JC39_9BACT|nr:MAG: hypothetical protein A3C23_03910 [Candidatus Roizmanbacteria bacterium RIFCSPHIGHO2_02_FULL_37_13b]OGK53174.1 MAG: hypothetical protein A3H78_06210 [Candidatus Roizmanbacteria bacterium RIFCSPLOWO2_02_FULL_36_11]
MAIDSYNHIQDVLDDNEKIIWQDKPTFIPFVASGLPFLGFGIIWGIMDSSFIVKSLSAPMNLDLMLIPFFLIHLMPLWLGILNFVRLFLVFNNTAYATTNRRILLRTGFLGIDFRSIDYDKIQDIRVDVNPFENMFGVGTIKINADFSGNRGVHIYGSISAIADPYKVFKQIKTVSVNIKTDWNYPNKLRPSDNPGYKTEYQPEE